MSLTYSLSDERVVVLQRTLVIEQPVTVVGSEGEGAAVARALGVALRAAIAEVATPVTTALAPPP